MNSWRIHMKSLGSCFSSLTLGRMPAWTNRYKPSKAWKRKVLNREIELEEIDTTAFTDRYGPNSVQVAAPKTTEVAV